VVKHEKPLPPVCSRLDYEDGVLRGKPLHVLERRGFRPKYRRLLEERRNQFDLSLRYSLTGDLSHERYKPLKFLYRLQKNH
jgi:hypothetical protein